MYELCIYWRLLGIRVGCCESGSHFKKHGVRFSESQPLLEEDDYAITIADDESDPDEQRFITVGTGAAGKVLVVVYCYRGKRIRIISARLAEPRERDQYEEKR